MNRKTATILLATTALSLGGCKSFLGITFKSDRQDVQQAALSDYFTQRLADGRRHLDAGRAAAAVTAFRQASYHPEYAAQAYNGMGVAYDRMGRPDLARRYFTLAMQADPADGRYARNLARLELHESATALARQEGAEAEAAALAAGAPLGPAEVDAQAVASETPAAVEGARDGLQRVSGREVRIASARTATAPAPAAVPPKEEASNERSSVHVMPKAQPGKDYPVRVALRPWQRKHSVAVGKRPARYPVRVALGPAKKAE